MKKDAWRRELSSYPTRGELLPRYTDVDLWQHLNNTALIAMHGENCQQWLREAFGAGVWREASPVIATVTNETDFLAEAHYPAPLATGTRLLGIAPAGFRLGSALFQNGHCVGLHEATLAVWVDGRPVPLPAAVMDTLNAAAARQSALPELDHAAHRSPVPGPLQALGDFPWRMTVATRFVDSDARGQTSDTSLARYAEQSRVQFLTHAFGAGRLASPTGFIVGHVATRWLLRGRPPVAWQVGCAVTRIGERSMSVRSALFDGDHCHAVCDSVMVVIDRDSRRSATLPEASRELLEPYRRH
jgi:acyl-CoA thioester hydrolase